MNSDPSRHLAIVYRYPGELKESPHNSRQHSKHQIRQVARSIQRFGFLSPILVDSTDHIIAGHARLEAARLLNLDRVPTISIEGLTQAEILAFIIADNKLAENSQWDQAKLSVEMQTLITIDPEFDLTVTGFEIAELDLIMLQSNKHSDPDDQFDSDLKTPVSQVGDLWLMGKHRLVCGNSLDTESYDVLLEGRKAAAVLTDPPFNVKIDGHATGNGSIHHRAFSMASGEMSESQFIAFLSTIFSHLKRHSKAGSLHYIFMDWRHLGELLSAGGQVYDDFINLCVWVKNNGGMGSFYRSRHELVLVFRAGKSQYQNNVQLGKYGRNRSNIWEYPCINSLSRNGEEGNLLALVGSQK